MQKPCTSSRSRKEFSNAYFLAKIWRRYSRERALQRLTNCLKNQSKVRYRIFQLRPRRTRPRKPPRGRRRRPRKPPRRRRRQLSRRVPRRRRPRLPHPRRRPLRPPQRLRAARWHGYFPPGTPPQIMKTKHVV